MWPNPQLNVPNPQSEEILNQKLHFLCSEYADVTQLSSFTVNFVKVDYQSQLAGLSKSHIYFFSTYVD